MWYIKIDISRFVIRIVKILFHSLNLNLQNRHDDDEDRRPVGLFQMVNALAGQSVDLSHPTDVEDDEEDLPPTVKKLIQSIALKLRNSADQN